MSFLIGCERTLYQTNERRTSVRQANQVVHLSIPVAIVPNSADQNLLFLLTQIPHSYKGIVTNRQLGPKSATTGFNEALAGIGAVDLAGVAQFVVLEHSGVVVEMIR